MPASPAFDDEAAVLRFERAIRAYRAHSEAFVVTPEALRADTAFRVRGASSREYVVDVLDASGEDDTCTCPDFLTNLLGTCKHVEAVHRALDVRPPWKPAYASLGSRPSVPTLGVDALGPIRLRVVGAHGARLFRALGATPGDDATVLANSRLRAGFHAEGIRITHAAVLAASLIARRRKRAARGSAVEADLRSDALRFDVLKAPLFPYQEVGVRHLVKAGRALLADDMGLGKTVQTIAACQILRMRGEARRILIVCPASLKAQWASEIAKYTGDRAVVIEGGVRTRHASLESDAPYIILNYELTWRDLSLLRTLDADVLVLDEAQRAKNFRTKTAETLRAIPSRFLFVLTGTPVENRLDDLYSLLQLVDPTVLGPLWRFNLDFHVQSDRGKVTGCKNLSALRERIEGTVLRRRKEEVLAQLPPLTFQTRYTKLSVEQEELEFSYRRTAATLMAKAERRALTPLEQQQLMAALLKARQACNAVVLCDPKSKDRGSAKLDELAALVSEIASQGTSKILVFSEWTEMLQLAAERLDQIGVGHLMLHGGVPTEKRADLLDRFRNDAGVTALLSTDSGGVGLNLQVASYVIHLDLPWNPAKLDQRVARAHRLGQTRGVSVTHLCAETGIERGIEGTLAGKRAIRSAALDPASTVDAIEAPSFSVFLRQAQSILNGVGGDDTPPAEAAAAIASTEIAAIAIDTAALAPMLPAAESAKSTELVRAENTEGRDGHPLSKVARNRLRLADVVLQAGFPNDAIRAAYEALSASLRSLLPNAIDDGHAPLVAALYRELVPSGRVNASIPSLFARLRDLMLLDGHAFAIEPSLATEAVRDVSAWITRAESASP